MVLACSACCFALASSARAQAIDSLIDSWKAFEKYSCVGVPFQPFRRAIDCSLSLSAVGLIAFLAGKTKILHGGAVFEENGNLF